MIPWRKCRVPCSSLDTRVGDSIDPLFGSGAFPSLPFASPFAIRATSASLLPLGPRKKERDSHFAISRCNRDSLSFPSSNNDDGGGGGDAVDGPCDCCCCSLRLHRTRDICARHGLSELMNPQTTYVLAGLAWTDLLGGGRP